MVNRRVFQVQNVIANVGVVPARLFTLKLNIFYPAKIFM